MTPSEVAAKERRDKRDVVRDFKAGQYVDPLLGAGYFALAFNSIRVSASAVNARRGKWFVPAAIATHKKKTNGRIPVSDGKRFGEKAGRSRNSGNGLELVGSRAERSGK